MASSSISNEVDWNRSQESKCKKRMKIGSENQVEELKAEKKIRWRTEAEQLSYSVKLVEALRQAQARRNSSSPAAVGGRAVRETADRVLAVAAKGRSRWSRAILTSRLRMRLNSNKHKKHKKLKVTGDIHIRSKKPVPKKTLPPLQRKVRVLGRLVPGCRKLPFPNILEEATDYIAALEMQVRAMDALAGLLTGAESFSGPPNLLGPNLP